MFRNFFILFIYIMIICQTQNKNPHYKILVTVNRNFNLRYVMNILSNNGQLFLILITQFWQLKHSWSQNLVKSIAGCKFLVWIQ